MRACGARSRVSRSVVAGPPPRSSALGGPPPLLAFPAPYGRARRRRGGQGRAVSGFRPRRLFSASALPAAFFSWFLSARTLKKLFSGSIKMPSARYAIFILPEKSLLSQVSKVDCEPPDRHSTSKKASGKVTPSSGSYAPAVAAAPLKTITQRLSAFILCGASPPYTPCFFLSISGRVATLPPQRLEGVLSMWGFAPPYPPGCTINP